MKSHGRKKEEDETRLGEKREKKEKRGGVLGAGQREITRKELKSLEKAGLSSPGTLTHMNDVCVRVCEL